MYENRGQTLPLPQLSERMIVSLKKIQSGAMLPHNLKCQTPTQHVTCGTITNWFVVKLNSCNSVYSFILRACKRLTSWCMKGMTPKGQTLADTSKKDGSTLLLLQQRLWKHSN